jgi:hypothetical protein
MSKQKQTKKPVKPLSLSYRDVYERRKKGEKISYREAYKARHSQVEDAKEMPAGTVKRVRVKQLGSNGRLGN